MRNPRASLVVSGRRIESAGIVDGGKRMASRCDQVGDQTAAEMAEHVADAAVSAGHVKARPAGQPEPSHELRREVARLRRAAAVARREHRPTAQERLGDQRHRVQQVAAEPLARLCEGVDRPVEPLLQDREESVAGSRRT